MPVGIRVVVCSGEFKNYNVDSITSADHGLPYYKLSIFAYCKAYECYNFICQI